MNWIVGVRWPIISQMMLGYDPIMEKRCKTYSWLNGFQVHTSFLNFHFPYLLSQVTAHGNAWDFEIHQIKSVALSLKMDGEKQASRNVEKSSPMQKVVVTEKSFFFWGLYFRCGDPWWGPLDGESHLVNDYKCHFSYGKFSEFSDMWPTWLMDWTIIWYCILLDSWVESRFHCIGKWLMENRERQKVLKIKPFCAKKKHLRQVTINLAGLVSQHVQFVLNKMLAELKSIDYFPIKMQNPTHYTSITTCGNHLVNG